MLTQGPLAPYFWFEIIGCVACAVICLTPALRRNGLLVTASLLAIAGHLLQARSAAGGRIPNH